MISEPEAAAHHFAHSPRVLITPGDLIAVYDLGGVTFDTAVLRCTAPDVFELAGPPGGTAGDEDTAEIGGRIFDRRILEYCGREIADEDSEAWTSTRLPLVEARVRERFGRADTQDDPKSIVALGAAAMDLERELDAPAGEPGARRNRPRRSATRSHRVPPPRDAPDPVPPRPLDRARLIGVPAIAAFVALCSVAAAGLGSLQAVSILSQFSGPLPGQGCGSRPWAAWSRWPGPWRSGTRAPWRAMSELLTQVTALCDEVLARFGPGPGHAPDRDAKARLLEPLRVAIAGNFNAGDRSCSSTRSSASGSRRRSRASARRS